MLSLVRIETNERKYVFKTRTAYISRICHAMRGEKLLDRKEKKQRCVCVCVWATSAYWCVYVSGIASDCAEKRIKYISWNCLGVWANDYGTKLNGTEAPNWKRGARKTFECIKRRHRKKKNWTKKPASTSCECREENCALRLRDVEDRVDLASMRSMYTLRRCAM